MASVADVAALLASLKGQGCLTCQYIGCNDNSDGMPAIQQIESQTGKWLAGIMLDFFHYNVPNEQAQLTGIPAAIDYAKAGGLVWLATHMPNPTTMGGVMDGNINAGDLLTAGTPTNQNFNTLLDGIKAGLLQLQNAGVPVQWRLFHECGPGQTWFWWGHLDQAQLKAAWLYVVAHMAAGGVTNTHYWFTGTADLSYYPGDGAPAMGGVGVDVYTNTPGSSDWVSRYNTFTGGSELPFIFAEFGSGDPNGGNGSFNVETLVGALKSEFPHTVLVNFWWTSWGIQNQTNPQAIQDPWMKNRGDFVLGAGAPAPSPPSTPAPSPTPDPGPTPTPSPSPGGSMITTTSGGSIRDAAGHVYTLDAGGNIYEDGTAIPGGAGTAAAQIIDGTMYAEDASGKGWFTWNGTEWTSATLPTPTPAPAPAPTPSPSPEPTPTPAITASVLQADLQAAVVGLQAAVAKITLVANEITSLKP